MLRIPDALRSAFKPVILLVCWGLSAQTGAVEPIKTHPRLLFRSEDLAELRSRMIPGNDVWMAFKTQIAESCLRDWKCSATHHYTGPPNYQWVRDSFTDEFGTTHYPKLAGNIDNPNWGLYSSQQDRPAAPEDDVGEASGNVRLFSEQYAMIFAFMARLLKDEPSQVALRLEYLTAAKECLFAVVNAAHQGIANSPWRHSNFAANDRSFSAEAFGLTVDWIYEDFDDVELAKLRKAFLLWAQQSNDHIYFAPTMNNGQHGPVNSPDLFRFFQAEELLRRKEIRLSLNNHWANHMRQNVLYALAFDPQDDVPVTQGSAADGIVSDTAAPGMLTSQVIGAGGVNDWVPTNSGFLRDATGVWLYLTDYAYRNDGAGGISMEGTQYASNGLGPAALMMTALHVAGQDDAQRWGPQVSLQRHPLWSKQIPAYLAQLTPTPRVPMSNDYNYFGKIFQPPLSGDLETFAYINDQYIKVLGPMALYDARVNGTNSPIVQAVRHIQRHLAQGGTERLENRIRNCKSSKTLRDAIYYFLLFDPSAAPAADPRPALQPRTFYAKHTVNGREMGMVLARSGYTPADTYFHWRNDWNHIDHQRGDSLSFGLWKNTLWLTKVMAGYGTLQGCSDYRNSLSLQNNPLPAGYGGNELNLYLHGSQWNSSPNIDPDIVARSTADGFLYFTGDGTALYNHYHDSALRGIEHASRSIVWLKPDHIVVYDRAKSFEPDRFKRFFLNLPEVEDDVEVVGNVVHATAFEEEVAKAELFITKLLPFGATPQITDIESGEPSAGEDMKSRMFTEAPGNPLEARFLHIVEGANAGVTSPTMTTLVQSGDGHFEGSVVGANCVMFRKHLDQSGDTLAYTHPAGVTTHYITGLSKFAAFDITQTATSVSIVPGTQRYTDGGGVLILGGSEPPNIEISAADAIGNETGNSLAFALKRSGDVSAALIVNIGVDTALSAANAADFVSLPNTVTFPANSAVATLTLTPADDAAYEGAEDAVVTLLEGAGYHASEAMINATGFLGDNDSPAGGTLALSVSALTVSEDIAGGKAIFTVLRTGGSAGTVSVTANATAGTATNGVQFAAGAATLLFGPGETSQNFEVTLLNNAIYHGDKTVLISLSQINGEAQLGTPNSATLTIYDDEPAPIGDLSFATASFAKAEGQAAFQVGVRRLNGNGGAVGVTLGTQIGSTATAGSDYTITPASLHWDDHDAAEKTFTFTPVDDTLYEGGAETVTFTLAGITGGAGVGSPSTCTVTISDNDDPPSVIEVGPGLERTALADVPWANLVAGSTVLIHPKPGGYKERVQMSAAGTAAEPIRIIGVTEGGQQPLLDGDGATTHGSVQFASFEFIDNAAIMTVRRRASGASSLKPAYLVIENLAFANARTDKTFLDAGGNSQNYSSTGAALYIAGAEHVKVRSCSFSNSQRGLAIRSGSTENDLSREVLVERCVFSGNSPNSGSGSNVQAEAVGFTLQFCALNRPAGTASGAVNIHEASAGCVIRYNRVEGGGYLLYGRDPQFNFGPLSALYNQAGFGSVQVYGNLFLSGRDPAIGADSSTDNSTLIQVGDIFGTPGTHRTGTMYFHHNTVLVNSLRSGTAIFSFSEPQAVVKASNNVFHHMQLAGGSALTFRKYKGDYELGANWLRSGATAGTGDGGMSGFGSQITGLDPLVNWSSGVLSAGSPCLDAALPLPVGAQAVSAQYFPAASGVYRTGYGGAMDLGAVERMAIQPSLYDAWTYSWFGDQTPTDGQPTLDADGDGAANLLEYGLGLEPLRHDLTWQPVVTRADGLLTLTLERSSAATDVQFHVEVSEDLADWSTGLPFTTTLTDTATQLQVRDAIGGSQRFIRLRVSR